MIVIKKGQIVIAIISLMLITAGYLNFNSNEEVKKSLETGMLKDAEEMAAIGDAKLVSAKIEENLNQVIPSNKVVSSETAEENNIEKSKVQENVEKKEEVSKEINKESDEYFTKSRLERDTMYSQMIESYQKILDKTNITDEQKKIAQNEIKKINEQKNAIMITENLLKTKGFEDLIIFINDKNINIIIKAKELKEDKIAQIQNIITREFKADIEDIHISNK